METWVVAVAGAGGGEVGSGMTTKIEWTDESWNPVTGCTKASAGCQNCYAERMSKRLRGRHGYPADDPFAVTLRPDRLEQPLRWRKPRMCFVCSMSDLFHPGVLDEFIHRVFDTIGSCPEHTFQILTKRPGRMRRFVCNSNRLDSPGAGWRFGGPCPLPNLWLGTSVEDQATADERIPRLLECPAAVRFVSAEPLLEPVNLLQIHGTSEEDIECSTLYFPLAGEVTFESRNEPLPLKNGGVDWVIVGGESGPGARPMHPDWARSLRDQCQAAGVPFFMKQMAKRAPIPDDLMIREFPND